MSLYDIPSGSVCVLDTNILIYAEQRASLQSERLMRRIEEQDVIGMLPQLVWQETIHRLMIIEAIMLGISADRILHGSLRRNRMRLRS